MTTQAQAVANRRNAAKSTGPKTTQGKAVVAQNAIQHGLLARQNVIRGEDPQEFDRHRRRMLEETEPVGLMEAVLADRIVSLSWRLKRAVCLQNEVFDALLAKELDRSMHSFDDELSAEDEQDIRSHPDTDPGLAIGRMLIRDFCQDGVLDRLQMYEQRIEGSLLKAMKELRSLQCERTAAEQSQSQALQQDHRLVETQHVASLRVDDAARPVAGDSAKQSQFPEGVPCETKPMEGEVSSGDLALQASQITPDTCRPTPDGVTTSAGRSPEAEDRSCETKPISSDGLPGQTALS